MSSFFGITIDTTVSKLKDAIGEPSDENNSGEDKTNFDWDVNIGDLNFTLYDWKEYRTISEDEKITFHIGGNDKATCLNAKDKLLKLLK